MKSPLSFSALALALALGGGVTACAQPASSQTGPAPASAGMGHRHSLMNQALGQLQLTSDEQTKIATLRRAYRAKEKGVTDPAQRKADAKQFRSDVMGVLTPDQAAQFQANMKSLRAQARAARAATPVASPTP